MLLERNRQFCPEFSLTGKPFIPQSIYWWSLFERQKSGCTKNKDNLYDVLRVIICCFVYILQKYIFVSFPYKNDAEIDLENVFIMPPHLFEFGFTLLRLSLFANTFVHIK